MGFPFATEVVSRYWDAVFIALSIFCDMGYRGYKLGRLTVKHHVKWLVPVLVVFLTGQAARAVEIGEIPPKIELKEKLGGRLDGKPWSSNELQGKVHVLFYVDPDEKDTNNDASEALDREKFAGDKFQSVAIINMAATWLPNFAISSGLKEKQKRYPRTIYVRDYKKVLVNAWKIADNSSDVLAFDKRGRLIFRKDGKLTAEEIQSLIKVIRDHL
jgi:YtfJ family uncharacterized protein